MRRGLAGRLSAGLALLALVASCAGEEKIVVAPIEGFGGLVAADEPHAAVVGREILSNGGNAADAATAMYFTLTVTYPSRASLDSGGACVAFHRDSKKSEAFLFLPRTGAAGGVIPLGPRAMAALQARYGRLHWGVLLSPAENMARFGFNASRALAHDFAAGGQTALADPEVHRIFAADGFPPGEGEKLVQADLAAILGAIRQQGAGYVHNGPFLTRFAEATAAAGLPVTAEELRDAIPSVVEPVRVEVSSTTAFFTPPPAANGLLAAELYRLLAQVVNYDGGDGVRALHVFLEASEQVFADRAGWLAPDGTSRVAYDSLLERSALSRRLGDLGRGLHKPATALEPQPQAVVEPTGGTSFAVGDRFGNAVACSFTMNGLFGAGRIAPGTGVLLAAPPPAGLAISPVAVVVASEGSGRLYFAGGASGGAVAATALVRVMFEALENDRPVAQAVAAGRVHHNGLPDIAFVEQRLGDAVLAGLAELGQTVQPIAAMGLVNAWHCPDALKEKPERCQISQDPRGFGLWQAAR